MKLGIDAGVETTGPFGEAIAGRNLVEKALSAFAATIANPTPCRISLQKNLPVASGIGGGSTDAAAALRLLSSAHPEVSDGDLWRIARELGADVPACLEGQCIVMTGIGEKLVETPLPNGLYAVLVNPLVAVSSNKTSQVFAKLGAARLMGMPREEEPPRFSSVHDVIGYAEARGNDLEPPARAMLPIIDVVLAELCRLDGNRLSRLSGAGPTCFGVFESESMAHAAASILHRRPRLVDQIDAPDLMRPANAEGDDLLERILLAAGWKDRQRIARDRPVGARPLERRIDSAVAAHERYGLIEIAVGYLAVCNSAVPNWRSSLVPRRNDRMTGSVIFPSRKSSPTDFPRRRCHQHSRVRRRRAGMPDRDFFRMTSAPIVLPLVAGPMPLPNSAAAEKRAAVLALMIAR